MSSLSIGIILSIIAGTINGSFAAPTKYAKVWKWENIYSVFGLFGMVIFPWLVVFLTIPNAGQVYHGVAAKSLLLTVTFGVGFGLAQIFFGLGIAAIGMALNFAIAIGISTVSGLARPAAGSPSRTGVHPARTHALLGSSADSGRNRGVLNCRKIEGPASGGR